MAQPRQIRGRADADRTEPDLTAGLAAAVADMGQGSKEAEFARMLEAMQATFNAQLSTMRSQVHAAQAQAPAPAPEDRSHMGDPRGDRNRDRDRSLTKSTGEPSTFTLQFEHSEMFNNKMSPAEHVKQLCSHFSSAPYLPFVFLNSSYAEFKHGGPNVEVRQGLQTLNGDMLTLIAARAAAHPGEAKPYAYLDIFTGARVSCIEAHSSMLDNGEPGAEFNAKYTIFTTDFPINTARFWKPGAFNSCADNVLSITSQAEWNRLDLGLAGVSYKYLIARPKAAGETIHCDAAVIRTYENFEGEPHNRTYRMWTDVYLDYAHKTWCGASPP